ncbi:HAD family hydrolase [Rhodoferax sp. 4810]|uniref:phosphoglycolate phosphatase n=1 Tax=Thiospirillum jenense TaxID=1653858 RepID=A0A839HK84_9GAMM|nr:HAD hydrolase-like protein [Thiospirillum jenense]MBB1075834.1 HAD family hydrolase [Rhodoferax jenense]MBB1126909.1 HAD family hydrolase [Thiospirillum jenense]
MYSHHRLMILDADGTTIDAFHAIEKTFVHHGMDIGTLERFQKRRNLFKYLGGFKEIPQNVRRQLGWRKRSRLVATLTEIYREEAVIFPGIESLIRQLAAAPDIKVGIVTRNITNEPLATLTRLFERHGLTPDVFDFLIHLPLSDNKVTAFCSLRDQFAINPARAYSCGDEASDFRAALGAVMHPFMVAYGFENFERLHLKHGVPAEIIAQTPAELITRVSHALNLPPSGAVECRV